MGLRTRTTISLVAAVLAAPLALTAASGGQADARAGAPATSSAGPGKTLTLITGDRLTLLDGGRIAVEKGKGREDVTFLTRRVGDRLQVIPSDALALTSAGRLDPRLFDLTTLVKFGYDDRRGDLPLIVAGTGNASVAALNGARHTRSLPSVRGAAVRADKRAGVFWKGVTAGSGDRRSLAPGITKIWLDGVREPSLDVSVPQIGAPAAWQAGYTGEGVTVAVVDTGIDESHPDLAGRVIQAQDFTGTGDEDTEGHGTHVASTIAGSGAASGGRYRGVAPGARLLDAKVCAARACPDSYVIAGMEWAVAQGAKVVNMSLGGTDSPEMDPLEQAVNHLTAAHGTLFVVSAGNRGDDESIGSPGSADAALTVGAVTKWDDLASFSSRGPRVGDAAIKPDVTAPGQDIVAARSSASSIGDPASKYATLSGTSMAAPHVAGAAAILAQRLPGATPDTLKSTLMASAVPHSNLGVFAQGAGRIDVSHAIAQQLTTSPSSLSFGRQPWPHEDDVPVDKIVTYRNAGSSPVILDLALEVRGQDGSPAPDGMFTVSTNTLTVPAGGQAQVTVTADMRVDGLVGYISGYLVATGEGVTARTPLAVDRQGLTHTVTAVVTDRAGQPAVQYNATLLSLEQQVEYRLYDADGTATVQVPPGRYALIGHVFTDGGDGRSLTKLIQPVLTVDGDQTVDVDARIGKEMTVSVERSDAAMAVKEVTAEIPADWGGAAYGILSFSDTPMYAANLGPDTATPGFTALFNTQWIKANKDGSVHDSPFFYHLAWHQQGRMFDGFSRAVRDKDLAQVRAEHAAQGDGGVRGAKASFLRAPAVQTGGVAVVAPFRLPFERTEFYNTDGGARWQAEFLQYGKGGVADDTITSTSSSAPETYRAGHRYASSWNQAVFAPALPSQEPNPGSGVARSGDVILVNLALHGDQAGREGFLMSSTGRTRLYQDGVLVGESSSPGRGAFSVSPEPAEYRLEVTADSDPQLALSTSVSGTWTFRSEHVEGGGGKGGKDAAVPQALSAVRFLPALDAQNALPAGRGYVIPIQVYSQAGATTGQLRTLSVEASFDDGKTWGPVRTVLLTEGRALATMPSGQPGYVSLRAHALDSDGNTVQVTVLRAYRIAG